MLTIFMLGFSLLLPTLLSYPFGVQNFKDSEKNLNLSQSGPILEWRKFVGIPTDSTGLIASPAIQDVNDDDLIEIFIGSSNRLYSLKGEDGSEIWFHDTLSPLAKSSPDGALSCDDSFFVFCT